MACYRQCDCSCAVIENDTLGVYHLKYDAKEDKKKGMTLSKCVYVQLMDSKIRHGTTLKWIQDGIDLTLG